jgi:hypothetical protein
MTTESSSSPTLSSEYILSVGTGFMAAKTLLTAVEFGVFTLLGSKPHSLAELEQALNLHPRASRDFLDALVALGFLERSNNLYTNTAPAAKFLDANSVAYIGAFLDMSHQRLYNYWDGLGEALRTGKPQNELKSGGLNLFDALAKTPKRHEQFLGAMTALSRAANLAIARKFPWGNYQSFLDLGTAQGDLPAQIVRLHPHLKGIGLDLPAVEPIFTKHVQAKGASHNLRYVAADFFKDPLPATDVILMGHILHDWNLDEKLTLIRKAWERLPKGGALIVYESMIDDARQENIHGLLMSLEMLIETHGGFDYTAADCQQWMRGVGFNETRKERLTGSEEMVIGVK